MTFQSEKNVFELLDSISLSSKIGLFKKMIDLFHTSKSLP